MLIAISNNSALCYAEVQGLEYGSIGSAGGTTTAGADYAGVSFLLQQEFTQSATIFAFRVCYRNQHPIRLQVWRPAPAANNSYSLVSEAIHKSESREDRLPALEEVSLRRDLSSHLCLKSTECPSWCPFSRFAPLV